MHARLDTELRSRTHIKLYACTDEGSFMSRHAIEVNSHLSTHATVLAYAQTLLGK